MTFRLIFAVLLAVAAAAALRCGDETGSPGPLQSGTPMTPTPPLGPPPSLLGLEPYYQKYLDAGGIPVVSSSNVSDEALFRAAATLDEMLAQRPEMREAIVVSGDVLRCSPRTSH